MSTPKMQDQLVNISYIKSSDGNSRDRKSSHAFFVHSMDLGRKGKPKQKNYQKVLKEYNRYQDYTEIGGNLNHQSCSNEDIVIE